MPKNHTVALACCELLERADSWADYPCECKAILETLDLGLKSLWACDQDDCVDAKAFVAKHRVLVSRIIDFDEVMNVWKAQEEKFSGVYAEMAHCINSSKLCKAQMTPHLGMAMSSYIRTFAEDTFKTYLVDPGTVSRAPLERANVVISEELLRVSAAEHLGPNRSVGFSVGKVQFELTAKSVTDEMFMRESFAVRMVGAHLFPPLPLDKYFNVFGTPSAQAMIDDNYGRNISQARDKWQEILQVHSPTNVASFLTLAEKKKQTMLEVWGGKIATM